MLFSTYPKAETWPGALSHFSMKHPFVDGTDSPSLICTPLWLQYLSSATLKIWYELLD